MIFQEQSYDSGCACNTAMAQNGKPIIPLFELQSNRGPVIRGPTERARQPKDAEAPLTAERFSGSDITFVILKKFSTQLQGITLTSSQAICTHRMAEET